MSVFQLKRASACLSGVSVLSLFLLCAPNLSAQNQQPSQAPLYGGNSSNQPASEQSGSATAGVFAPVLDAEKRPITAGGFVKTAPPSSRTFRSRPD